MQFLGPVFEPVLKKDFRLKLFRFSDKDNSFIDLFIKFVKGKTSS